MKKIIFLSLVTLFIGCETQVNQQTSQSSKTTERPNIVMFLVDDMGWQDTSVPFWKEETPLNRTYNTPNMERMAEQGMKFTQAYANSVCSPTRISLMTGTNAARHRVTNWTLYKNSTTDHRDPNITFPKWNVNGMSPQEDTERAFYSTALPQLLTDAGYYTIHSGKAHFGAIGTPASNPRNIGFQVNIAGHAGGGLQSYYGKDNFGNIPGKTQIQAIPGLQEFYGQDIFVTEAITQKALQELDKRPKNQPFFLYLAHYAVHIPIMPDPRFIDKYLAKGMNPTEAAYATLVEGMDKSLGDVLDYLEKHNLMDNTIVLFMSDNGGLDVEAHGRKGDFNTHNAPLSSGKGSAYEGGIREPMLVLWKGKVLPGSVTDRKVIIEDFFPTILEMAKVSNPKTIQKVDGKSFVPILEGKEITSEEKNRPLYWHMPNRWTDFYGYGIGPSSTIRLGDYKLIYYYYNQKTELFNIEEDISEQNNLVDKLPEKAKELATQLTKYLKEVDAQIPKDTKTNQYIPYPDGSVKGKSR